MGDIFHALKKLMTDINVNVLSQAIKVVACCAKAGRKAFSSYAKSIAPLLLAVFKEKKITVIKPANEALDNIWENVRGPSFLTFARPFTFTPIPRSIWLTEPLPSAHSSSA